MHQRVPTPLEYAAPSAIPPRRPVAVIAIALTAILAGPVVGASTNAINAFVSPPYFVSVMGWIPNPAIWDQSVIQGAFEGCVVGLVVSLVVTLTVAVVSKATCPYPLALTYLLAIILADYCFWVAGGLGGLGLAASFPRLFQRTFIGVPFDTHAMLRYAWVGGSIWGAEIGGFLAVVIGLLMFRANWRRRRFRL